MSAVLETLPLGFPWQTVDPFLFCVHHDDAYPAGNEKFGPQASLAGRNLGNDFVVLDADPLADIRNVTRLHRVVKDGVIFDPGKLLAGG